MRWAVLTPPTTKAICPRGRQKQEHRVCYWIKSVFLDTHANYIEDIRIHISRFAVRCTWWRLSPAHHTTPTNSRWRRHGMERMSDGYQVDSRGATLIAAQRCIVLQSVAAAIHLHRQARLVARWVTACLRGCIAISCATVRQNRAAYL